MGRVMQNVFPAAGAACAKVLKLPEPSKVCFEEPIEGQCVQSWGFPGGASGKEPTCQCRKQETRVRSLGQEDPLEEGIATHSSILACGEFLSTENPVDRGAWRATVRGVAQSQTRLT